MIGTNRLVEWLRNRGARRDRTGAVSPRTARGRVFGWILACCVLLAILGIQQFVWIGRVSDYQRQTAQLSVFLPTRASLEQIRNEIGLLLWIFKPHHDPESANRSRRYLERYLLWHAVSRHGSVVKRILFYDRSTSRIEDPTSLFGESDPVERANLDEDLALVRRHIDEFGFKFGRKVATRWTVTWVFHPPTMTVYRPSVRREFDSRNNSYSPKLTGYLILQLDEGFIRDHLIPEVLSLHFRELQERAQYSVTLALNGQTLYDYEASDPVRIEHREAPMDVDNYSFRLSLRQGTTERAGRPDLSVDFPLRPFGNQSIASRHGVVQRVSLRTRAEISRLLNPPPLIPAAGIDSDVGSGNRVPNYRASIDLPRLLVAADALQRLAVQVRREESSVDQVINLNHKRSVAITIAVVVLLVGAMAMVARSTSNATQLADLRIAAVAAQSHHLRNPLAGISILGDNIAQGMLGDNERLINYGRMICEYGRRVDQIVNRTVGVAAKDSPGETHRLAMLDVSKIASDALEDARPAIDSAGFEVESSFAEQLPLVRADGEGLRQCLVELLSNALKYGRPGRWIKLETCETGSGSDREVLIRVRDRGRGIPGDEAWKVFEPYYRVASVANSSISGSGLGLALVRNMVERMGAKLTLQSEERVGSVFAIHFSILS